MSKTQVLKDARDMLYVDPKDKNFNFLSSPKHKREEIREIRRKLDEYSQFKENGIYLGKRERTIKGGWRHGITGIDNADSEHTSVFFQDAKKIKDFAMSEKAKLNN